MIQRKLKGLFINNVEAQCSIYESGKMVYDCLTGSEKYSLDYVEITRNNAELPANYDFYFFNHHFQRWHWLKTEHIKRIVPGVTFALVLEVSPNDPFVYCSPNDFDAYIVVDPSLSLRKKHVYAFPRPLEVSPHPSTVANSEVPVIGSFGFGTPGKGFEHVIDAVNREFDRAVVRLNIPRASYWDQDGKIGAQMGQMCKDRARDGVDVIVTHDFMSKEELIDWCRKNTLNCFLYDRNQPGLAATTDQAITAGRPLITSKNNTFRHIQKYIKPFPYQTLKEAIEKTPARIEQIQHDWSPQRFRERFDDVLDDFRFNQDEPSRPGTVKLRVKPGSVMQEFRNKAAFRTRLRKLFKKAGLMRNENTRKPRPTTSYSQFGEDLIIFDLLTEMSVQGASYLDIGAGDPQISSNSYLFYREGFTGVLVAPDPVLAAEIRAMRPNDTVLNAGIEIASDVAEAAYEFADKDNGSATSLAGHAKFVEETGVGGIRQSVESIEKLSSLNLNDVITNYFTECPDLISINAEGRELQILKTLDFEKYNPAVFCVRTHRPDRATQRINQIRNPLDRNGYFTFMETQANTIFVNKNLYDFYLYQRSAKAASGPTV